MAASFSANSNNPLYASTDTHDAIKLLPKDIVILDWQYRENDDYPTIEYFKKKGFTVWGVSWHDPLAAVSLAKSVERYKGEGILASDWGLWRTMSPAATSLFYTLKAGYDTSVKVEANGEDAIIALAEEMRDKAAANSENSFAPIELDKVANGKTRDNVFGDGEGFVDLGSAFDLRALPAGQYTFAGIPFRTLPFDGEGQDNCLIATGSRAVTVPMGDNSFQSLAFLHTVRLVSPHVFSRQIGEYEVVYADGNLQHIPLIEGYNITDVRSGPGVRKNPWRFSNGIDILIGSQLGWRGPSLSGMPMNVQVMRWDNPYPEKAIREIRLLPKDGTTLVLLALSVKR